ncbi:SIMPL domain-containing protein [Nodosilinea sp. P-1105]|uniref:SIMPL domain-containing protein n=1 Tax=Nodosilinea sp. P-1105 TaxID=2546229 RepID=UPI00146B8B30|nr:SIMPL domain-containing protein [Nodosilinea sp. P-1105]NMF83526.1 DUF541 domain-containing protein [Nodosilinea sp. P-1105]
MIQPVKHYGVRRLGAVVLTSVALVGSWGFAPLITPRAMAQEIMMRTLTVTGQGEQSVQTTKAQVVLGVEAQGPDAATVQQEIARRSTAVVDLLRSRQVENLETTGIQLSPRYRYEDGESILVGYSGSNTVSFQMPTEAVGPLLDAAVDAGANQIRSVSFLADDDALDAARQQALREAVADAQAQADTVLASLNLSAQEIVSIQLDGAAVPPPQPMPRAMSADSLAEASTPVIGGEQTVEARVTLQIRY